MRYAILSDIHANVLALEAVLADISAQAVDGLLYLGDAIGYGPQAAETITLLRTHVSSLPCRVDGIAATRPIWVPGNHEWGLLNRTANMRDFYEDALVVLLRTRNELSAADLDLLALLPQRIEITLDNISAVLVHSSGSDPVGTHQYITNEVIAADEIDLLGGQINFVGHTHVPSVFYESNNYSGKRRIWQREQMITEDDEAETIFVLDMNSRAILNPGSVGQPRDGDRRASYAIFDGEVGSFTVRRVDYDIAEAQARIQKWLGDAISNLDSEEGLAGRLALGL
ncbi:MAG: metallophosphoesterase family protein [Chloroflexales bacterium]